MKRWSSILAAACLSLGVLGLSVSDAKPPVAQKKIEKAPVDPQAEAAFREQAKKIAGGSELDKVLALENKERGAKLDPMPVIDDLTFLRRIYCDLISRIPSVDEIAAFEADTSPFSLATSGAKCSRRGFSMAIRRASASPKPISPDMA